MVQKMRNYNQFLIKWLILLIFDSQLIYKSPLKK